jgi:hypothetical protein
MAHYAFINDDNIVIEVITGVDETELIDGQDPETWYGHFRGQRCVRTSYNGNIRKHFAGVGYTYDETADVFISPQPFPSWTLDDNHDWQPPTPQPEGPFWEWNETGQTWVQVTP